MTLHHSILKLIRSPERPFVYVDCGARGGSRNPLVQAIPGALHIGFEPDGAECERLQHSSPANYSYYPVAVGKTSEKRTLHLTARPSCSSLLEPDHDMWDQFAGGGNLVAIRGVKTVETVALDSYLPKRGINQVDFLKLDTQGTELEILQGAGTFLDSTVLGIVTEVEFSPMYRDQPLFSDIDPYLKESGFMLFDLTRHRYRRTGYPTGSETRGQLVAGDAFYLKDYRRLTGNVAERLVKLIFIASFYGFNDYALEVAGFLLNEKSDQLEMAERAMLEQICHRYGTETFYTYGFATRAIRFLNHPPLRKILRHTVRWFGIITHSYAVMKRKDRYEWRD